MSTLLSIFKPGTHISASGVEMTFTDGDLAATAAAYDPAKHNAPLVLGHPKDNAPAYGWTNSLIFQDGYLQASPDAVSPEFSEWVNAGYYKKISAAFYAPTSPHNPVPGVFYLRHIGFLGAQPPAIKGLPEPSFAASADFITIDFSEESSMTEEEKRLAAEKAEIERQKKEFADQQATFSEQQAELRKQQAELDAQKMLAKKREHNEFAESMIKSGKLLPKDKLGAVEFMQSLDESVLEFGEGDTVTKTKPLDWFKGFIKSLPAQVDFKERTAGSEKEIDFSENADAIANAATEYQEAQRKAGREVSDIEAIQFVMKRG
jgi:hypothetical protein